MSEHEQKLVNAAFVVLEWIEERAIDADSAYLEITALREALKPYTPTITDSGDMNYTLSCFIHGDYYYGPKIGVKCPECEA